MFRSIPGILAALAALGAPLQLASSESTGWEAVGTGIEYREYKLPGPNQAYVARMDRSDPSVILETAISDGAVAWGKETVSQMAERYDEALNAWNGAWGPRNHVVVAINGSFYDPETGIPDGAMVSSGWFTNWHLEWESAFGFAWTHERQAYLSMCMYILPERQRATFLSTGATQPVSGVDSPHGGDDLVVYTPAFDTASPGGDQVAEVLVEVSRPVMVMPQPAMVKGIIREIRDGGAPFSIPFDHIVLSAIGRARKALLENSKVGEQIGISLEITELGRDCQEPLSPDWTKAYAALGGSYDFLREGEIQDFDDPGAILRHPRTAICYNDSSIYFVVVDGRQGGRSIGMSIRELATFCKEELRATWGINQDGGGSSTIWVNGEVKNQPSDGREREVANGLMMVVVEAPQLSARFSAAQRIVTQHPAEIRLGPGTNFPPVAQIPVGSEVQILSHPLQGVLAKHANWWKVRLEDTVGWISQQSLVYGEEEYAKIVLREAQVGTSPKSP